MSIGADSLMFTVDMTKLLNKKALDGGQVVMDEIIAKQNQVKTRNLQVADLIRAMASSEPCLFNNSSTNLMPVTEKNVEISMVLKDGK